MSELNKPSSNQLFNKIKQIVEESRTHVAQTINATLTITYWNIGKIIKEDILHNKRAAYGEEIIQNLSKQLTQEYGNGWSTKHLQHCLRIAETFPDCEILYALSRELSWTHLRTIMYLDSELKRNFYLEICRIEKWSTRQLRDKIDSMLFERTAISKKPEELAKLELLRLKNEKSLSPDLVFRDHYVLDFLNLKDSFSENDLESAIIRELESFILELGGGFTFVARQKRMTIDNTDYYLDLLFYHRKLKRLIAIELKIGKFKATYKGQMELYLRWLEKHEMEDNEELPIGLILCSTGNQEQVELLQLNKANIKVAEYIYQQLPAELLQKKLHQFAEKARQLIENRVSEN
jgi:predicted nuclease of restriction endonuclease-like (RecB) superfamily